MQSVLILYSRKCSQKIDLVGEQKSSDDAEVQAMMDDIFNKLRRGTDVIRLLNTGVNLRNTCKTTKIFDDLECKYDDFTGHRIRKLKGFVSELEAEESFYVFKESNDATNIVERRTVKETIHIEQNKRLYNCAFHKNSLLHQFLFTTYSFGFDGLEIKIGEKDKSKRTCRFCGTKDNTKFRTVAHAIPEALGNTLLICNEECDDCNNTLSKLEENFVHLMDIRRADYGIHHKGSKPDLHINGQNFVLKTDASGKSVCYIQKEAIEPGTDITKPFPFRLKHKYNMTNEGAYKALCKMVIDLIPQQYLSHFQETIRWIMSSSPKSSYTFAASDLPDVMYGYFPRLVFKQPVLDICINENNRENTPYCTGVLYICDMVYVFVVPFTEVDNGRFHKNEELEQHWNTLQQLTGGGDWQIQKVSEWYPCNPWVDVTVDPKSPVYSILSKNNPVFSKCNSGIKQIDAVDFPPFCDTELYGSVLDFADFILHYKKNGITDDDLLQVTVESQYYMDIVPAKNTVTLRMQSSFKDNTSTVSYFDVSFSATHSLKHFSRQINIDGVNDTIAINIDLTRAVIRKSFAMVDIKIDADRSKTVFSNCSFGKLATDEKKLDRMIGELTYLIHLPNNRTPSVKGKKLHVV